MGYFSFFFTQRTKYRPDFNRPVPNTVHYKKKFTKNPLNLYLLKVEKIHSDSVKNESATTKDQRGGRPVCLGLKMVSIWKICLQRSL